MCHVDAPYVCNLCKAVFHTFLKQSCIVNSYNDIAMEFTSSDYEAYHP